MPGSSASQTDRVDAAGDHVALAVEPRDPPAVDDVATGAAHEHVGARRDDHLPARDDRRVDATAARLRRVVDLPPPLLAGDVDEALGVVRLGQGHQRADGRDGDADEDDRRQDRQADLQRRAPVGLLGDRLAAVAVPVDDPADGAGDDQPDEAGEGEHGPLQVLDLLGVLAGRLPRVLRRVAGAPGDGDRSRSECEQVAAAHGAHGTRTSTSAPSTPGTTKR